MLGLTRQHAAAWGVVFGQVGVDPAVLSNQAGSAITSPVIAGAVGPDFPYTPAAMHVLELATTEARDLGQTYVGAEHVLVALLREGSSPAAQVLLRNHVTLDRVRDALARWTPPSAG